MDKPSAKEYLFILNDPPYGTERPYNALRLALNLMKRPETSVRVFLMGDAIGCAVAGQKPPTGYYHIEHMLSSISRRGEVATCGTCQAARGIEPEKLVEGVRTGSMDLLGDWMLEAQQVLVY